MKFEVSIDKNCREPKIIIQTDSMTEEISEIIKRLSDPFIRTITGFSHKGAEMIDCKEIIRVFCEKQKVIMQTDDHIYTVNLRLYELEDKLDKKCFVRISNAEIVNIRKIKCMDVSVAGTICMVLQGDIRTFVSRRYVSKIKKILEI